MTMGTDWVAAQLEGVRAAIYDTIVPRRERIATAALQGLLASGLRRDHLPDGMALAALAWADALIAELDKEQKG